jgi:hypothetical protein
MDDLPAKRHRADKHFHIDTDELDDTGDVTLIVVQLIGAVMFAAFGVSVWITG